MRQFVFPSLRIQSSEIGLDAYTIAINEFKRMHSDPIAYSFACFEGGTAHENCFACTAGNSSQISQKFGCW